MIRRRSVKTESGRDAVAGEGECRGEGGGKKKARWHDGGLVLDDGGKRDAIVVLSDVVVVARGKAS